jgi:hypothetical protein
MQSMTQSLSDKVIKVTTFQAKQEIKKCDVTYDIFVLGLGLASQEVDVLTKSTNESTQILYGYKEMTKPQFLVQAKIQLGQDVIIKLGLVRH